MQGQKIEMKGKAMSENKEDILTQMNAREHLQIKQMQGQAKKRLREIDKKINFHKNQIKRLEVERQKHELFGDKDKIKEQLNFLRSKAKQGENNKPKN